MDVSTDALRVVIADDHQLFREGLKGMLQDAGMEVVGEAADGADAAALVAELQPAVAVLDLNMPGTSGLQALRRIARSNPDIQTVVLTVSAEDGDVVEALAAGACGYLLKDTHVDRLADGIRQAAAGHMVVSGDVAKALIARVRAEAQGDAHAAAGASAGPGGTSAAGIAAAAAAAEEAHGERPALTPREREVLQLIVEGADNVAIGRALSISPHTVKQYVTNIFEKLGVHSRVQAAVYAVRAELA
ncbi:MAG TPA: response regulator transcription factor [Solirubrobacteraceae bacterium]|nr:response regulator transcription factor [Solirubrobacteraceae bacterium]